MRIKIGMAGLTALGLLVSGCSSGNNPVESADLAAYACALADELDGPAESWGEGGAGPESLQKLSSAHSITHLVGSSMAVQLDGFNSLSQAATELNRGLIQIDYELIDIGVDQVRAACLGEGLETDDVDVSVSGRIAFGCRIADDLDADEIDIAAAARAEDGSRFTAVKLMSAANLLGDIVVRDEIPTDLYEAALEFFGGLSDGDNEQGAAALNTIHEECNKI